ncbi:conserved hypothetical protein, secreted, partial [mine drainage metagenome]
GALFRVFFFPLFLTLLVSCGNPPSNSNNTNFPYGMAVCSSICNAYSQTGSPPSIGTPFAAVTSYGSRQVLIFTGYTNSSSNAWLISNNSLSPNTSLYNSLQGPDGLLISSQGLYDRERLHMQRPRSLRLRRHRQHRGHLVRVQPERRLEPGPHHQDQFGGLPVS